MLLYLWSLIPSLSVFLELKCELCLVSLSDFSYLSNIHQTEQGILQIISTLLPPVQEREMCHCFLLGTLYHKVTLQQWKIRYLEDYWTWALKWHLFQGNWNLTVIQCSQNLNSGLSKSESNGLLNICCGCFLNYEMHYMYRHTQQLVDSRTSSTKKQNKKRKNNNNKTPLTIK